MPAWLTWLGGVVFILGESTMLGALGVTGWTVQAGLVCAILLGLRRNFMSGALTLAALLPVADAVAGGPGGYYAVALVAVYFVMQVARGRLRDEWGPTHFVVAAIAAVLHPTVMVGTMVATGVEGSVVWAVVWSLPVGVAGPLLVVWPAQWTLSVLDAAAERVGRGRLDLE